MANTILGAKGIVVKKIGFLLVYADLDKDKLTENYITLYSS